MVTDKELSLSGLSFDDGDDEYRYRQRRKARFYSNSRSTSPRRIFEDRRKTTRYQTDRRCGQDRRGEPQLDPWGSAI